MPTTLGPKYSTDWRGKPPHMLAPDIPVWYRFLTTAAGEFISLYYDCLLGGETLSASDEQDPMKRMWRDLTAKRADAIAETNTNVWIIEVSAYPGMRALGQLMTYQNLWRQDPKIDKPDQMILVADQVDPDIGPAMESYGISLHLV